MTNRSLRPHRKMALASGLGAIRKNEGQQTDASVPTGRMTIRALLATVFVSGLLAHSAEGHVKGCHTRACDRRVHEHRVQKWCLRTPRCVWKHRFLALPAAGRRWAHCVSFKESRNHRIARASGFLSYFQWVESTWHMAGGSGNPEYTATWFEQAVRAWFWHIDHPWGQWPNTGEGGRCGS